MRRRRLDRVVRPAAEATFSYPAGVAVDRAGNVYVSDSALHRIFLVTPDRMVSVYAGSGARGFADGSPERAQFSAPRGLALDATGNLYVADAENDRIRRISPGGWVTTYAGSGEQGFCDGPVADARFNEPWGLSVDTAGCVYVADRGNHRIRRSSPDGTVSTLAGSGEQGFADGPPAEAVFDEPEDVAVDDGGVIYVADSNNNRVRRIGADGTVTTLAGTGEAGIRSGRGAAAQFSGPEGIAVSPAGYLVVADAMNNCLRRVSRLGRVSPLAGIGISTISTHVLDGPVREAELGKPAGLAVDQRGIVYVADEWNHCIRRISPDGSVSTYAGSGEPDW